ncbi:Protein of unknown function DUF1764 [Trypanosoma melophagium]|uniref:Protein of unknown function DUF1764 n=1 Tax=Trypanosoma melophagium TaxID=715481 RepID=UPI00351A0507|nr:Protein of unknown function DUF1764 [Trypanosoma melophagium]
MKRKAKKPPQQQDGTTVKGITTAAAERRKSATVVINPKEEADIAEIFGVIRKAKKPDGDNHTKNSKMESKRSSKTNNNTPAKPRSDGLYRAPEKTLDLSDAAFFDFPSQRRKGREEKSKTTTSAEISGDVLQREGVHRIISMDELQKITSSNPKAGTTPNCPFDCDCCF